MRKGSIKLLNHASKKSVELNREPNKRNNAN